MVQLQNVLEMALQLFSRFEFEAGGKQILDVGFSLKEDSDADEDKPAYPDHQSVPDLEKQTDVGHQQHEICPEVVG